MTNNYQVSNTLKKALDKTPVAEIEKDIDLLKASEANALKNKVERLIYLERTRRFSDNPEYRNKTFIQYLNYRHGMKRSQLDRYVKVFAFFSKEAEVLPVDVIADVQDKCDSLQAKKVIEKILKFKPNSKDYFEKIKSEIQVYTGVPQPNPKRRTVAQLDKEVAYWKEENAALRRELSEMEDQIVKLKATVKVEKKINADISADRDTLKAKLSMLQAEIDQMSNDALEIGKVAGSAIAQNILEKLGIRSLAA